MLETRRHKDINMTSIGIGTWTIGGPYWTEGDPTGWGGPLDDAESVAGLRLALENGVTHIDTADVYGYGRSERLVGKALEGNKMPVTLASKVGWAATTAPHVFSPENIRFQCEQSLRNLKRDVIDVYYAHHCDFGPNDLFLDDAVQEFNKLKQEGLIRSIALSGYAEDDLIRVATKLKPDFIQSWASIEHREFIREEGKLAQFMAKNDIKFVAMMPFGQGRLLGKYDAATPPAFEKGDNRQGNVEFSAASLDAFQPRLEKLRARFGASASDLILPALGFLLSHPSVISVIPGFRNTAQVKGILAAAQKSFTAEDRAFIEEAFPFEDMPPHPWTLGG